MGTRVASKNYYPIPDLLSDVVNLPIYKHLSGGVFYENDDNRTTKAIIHMGTRTASSKL